MRIAHIINPVRVGPQSDLFEAQPFVWEAMRVAREFARDVADVELIAVCYAEDVELVPPWFTAAPLLTRSAADLPDCHEARKLPLIADILAHGLQAAPMADYVIYSNADIILMPYAYTFIAERLAAGVDALTVNRRTIRADTARSGLSAIWAAVGKPHEGHDFFVCSRSVYDRMQLDQVLIGVPLIGWALNANLAVLAARYEYYHDTVVLTKHLGDDRTWKTDDRSGLIAHNVAATNRAFAALGVTREAMVVHRAGYHAARQLSWWTRLLRRLRSVAGRLRRKR